jgi:preprotein translocase subunit SecY
LYFLKVSRVNVEVVSARQLSYLENLERNKLRLPNSQSILLKDTGLSIRLTQAGIFPIILAANFLPLFSAGMNFFQIDSKILNSILYYVLIVGFNYFYTILFWDPEKISTQLRKASVSIVNVTPGKDTVNYLENVVKGASLAGGVILACILLFYDILKQIIQTSLFNQLNISSLIILIGVAYEDSKNLYALFLIK